MGNSIRFRGIKGVLAIFAVLAALVLWYPAAHAQDAAAKSSDSSSESSTQPKASETENPATAPAPESASQQQSGSADVEDPGAMAHGPKTYLEPTIENLSKLYWALGMFDIDKDDVAVNNYIMINECQIYRDFYTDDFEWNSVQAATREYLRANMKKFPRRFEFMQPIELGRYNEDTQTFEVLTDSITQGSRALYSDANTRVDVCGKKNSIEAYPRNVVVSLSRPIHYPQIPINDDLARDYIVRTKIRNEEDFRGVSEEYSLDRLKGYQRLAFIVVKVRMIKFMEMRRTRGGTFPVIFSALEGVEIYEDPKKKRLLYSSLARTKTEQ